MIKIKLSDLELTSSLVLVKPDPNFDFIPVKGPEGEVKIYLAYNPQDETKHVSITGSILKLPAALTYYGEILSDPTSLCMDERSSKMRTGMPYITKMNVVEGDKIYFNYHNQFQALEEGRLIDVEDHGICMLMHYETFYGKEVEDEFVPLNGYVLFKRDQIDADYQTESGLHVVRKQNVYGSNLGTVLGVDERVTGYLDRSKEDDIEIKKGDRIVINPKFGYRIAYSIHGGAIKDCEIIRRKYIWGIFDEMVASIKR